MIVLDTNIVLDLLVFDDPATRPLKDALTAHRVQWIATQAMRDELARVLTYSKIVPRLARYKLGASDVLVVFDRQVQLVDAAQKTTVTCKDADDQKFIDLAVAHQATLLSKDRAVLCMAKRLSVLGIRVQSAVDFAA